MTKATKMKIIATKAIIIATIQLVIRLQQLLQRQPTNTAIIRTTATAAVSTATIVLKDICKTKYNNYNY